MDDRKALLCKVRTIAVILMCAVIISAIGIGYGKHAQGHKALAAKETETETEKGIETEEDSSEQGDPLYSELEADKLLTTEEDVATVTIPETEVPTAETATIASDETQMNPEAETEEKIYDEISTYAIAQEVMEELEKETLELMASPAGTVWGGKIKVLAGKTPLLITEEDKEVLLRIVEAEATCEDVKGRMLVANVIMNRVVSDRFPDSIAEVVFQNNGKTYQFAPIKDGRYWTVKISDKTREAVERVLAGEDYSQGAMYFAARKLANKKAMSWFDTSLEFLFRHGVHEFFKDK